MASEQTLQGGTYFLPRESSLPSNIRLDGKVAIVTGGAQGIGKAIACLFVEHGAKVVVADVNDSVGMLLVDSLLPHSLDYVHCDVTKEPDVEYLVSHTLAKHSKIDIFINSAGVLGTQSMAQRSIAYLNIEEFDRVMQVNVKGVALGMKHAARAMTPMRRGSIVSMASVAGTASGLSPHAWSGSKHAVSGLTRSAARELGGYGIRVNCISPFREATAMLIEAWSDVAETALYLASDESKYVSGHNILIDGGFTTSRRSIG